MQAIRSIMDAREKGTQGGNCGHSFTTELKMTETKRS